jgi:N-ethylmaleimide reductase
LIDPASRVLNDTSPAISYRPIDFLNGAPMTSTSLFQPLKVGPYELSHRVAMAPLTRMRAEKDTLAAWALNAEYYAQRATKGGLIIAEASQVMQEGQGSPNTPGIYTKEQIAGWRQVTDAVHAKGGIIFLQLWHVGRASHSSFQPGGGLPVAPSAIAINATTRTATGETVPYEVPRALETSELPGIIEAYRQGTRNAIEAGFDGVEIHGANGYLLEQFLQARSNTRTDQYGGSIENRARLLLEVTEAVVATWSADRVAIRISPYGVSNDSGEADPMPLYSYVTGKLDRLGLAYLHLVEPRTSGVGRAEVFHDNVPKAYELFRPLWNGVLVTAGGFDGTSAEEAVASGDVDVIAFGRPFIANPDLPERIRQKAPFTPYNRATFYGGAAGGYTDYPFLNAAG